MSLRPHLKRINMFFFTKISWWKLRKNQGKLLGNQGKVREFDGIKKVGSLTQQMLWGSKFLRGTFSYLNIDGAAPPPPISPPPFAVYVTKPRSETPSHLCVFLTQHDIYRSQWSCGQGYVFTRVCDSVHRGGCYPSMHCRWYPSMPCTRSPGGCLFLGGLLLGGLFPGGCLLPGGVPCLRGCGLLLWPSGLVAFWLKVVFWSGGLVESGLLVWWPSDLVALWFGGLLIWWPYGLVAF